MQYVPGDTLRDVVAREGRVDPRRAVELTIRLADALDFGHRRGIVHCDVKPGNVLLGDHGEPKIVDFGIARSMATATDIPSVIAGTVGYIAPEQIEGKPLDGRADVYSLAAVLYEMLAGKPPYSGNNLAAVAAQRLTQPPPPLREANPAVAPDLERIVLRGLERDPARRYDSAHTFAEDLRGYLDTLLNSQTRRAAPITDDRTTRRATAPPPEGYTERISVARGASTAPGGAIPVERASQHDGSRPWLFLTLAGTLVAVITGLAVLLAANLFDLGGGGSVLVPAATGQPVDEAARSIKSVGLVIREVRFESDAAPFGVVIDQNPPPDTRLEHGDPVDLRVSVGPGSP
jgi:serine/threonine-protein kinase